MTLDHEGLDVYQLALDFLVFANGIIEGLPPGLRVVAASSENGSGEIAMQGA
jgi:hypothetical protein